MKCEILSFYSRISVREKKIINFFFFYCVDTESSIKRYIPYFESSKYNIEPIS